MRFPGSKAVQLLNVMHDTDPRDLWIASGWDLCPFRSRHWLTCGDIVIYVPSRLQQYPNVHSGKHLGVLRSYFALQITFWTTILKTKFSFPQMSWFAFSLNWFYNNKFYVIYNASYVKKLKRDLNNICIYVVIKSIILTWSFNLSSS